MMANVPGEASSTNHRLPREDRSRRLPLFLENTFRDIRLSCRTLGRNPGFTIVAVATLALGIGVNTAVFTLFDAVALRPLPVPDPHQIVYFDQAEYPGDEFSFPEYLHIEKTNQTLSGLIAYDPFLVYLSADGFTESLWGELTSSNYTDVLGIEPIVGRGFLPEEGLISARDRVAMISARLWRDRFHSAQNIVGKTVRLNGHRFTLIGVLPEGFSGLFQGRMDVWVPLVWAPLISRGQLPQMFLPAFQPEGWLEKSDRYWLKLAGRLKPDVSLDSAQASLTGIGAQLDAVYPRREDRILTLQPGNVARLHPSLTSLRGRLTTIWTLLGAIVGAVLLIACSNVAGLLLSRGRGRRLEMAVRLAAGASRERLTRYLLTETTLVFLAGGLASTLVVFWFLNAMNAFLLPGQERLEQVLSLGLNGRVLFFALILSLTTAIAFGLFPAARSSRIDVFPELKAPDLYARIRSGRWRHLAVVLQVTLSFMSLVVAAIFIRSLDARLAPDPGFDPANVSTLSVDLVNQGYNETEGSLFLRQLLRRVSTTAGVESASLALSTPVGERYGAMTINPKDDLRTMAIVNSVSPGYFETVRIPLIRGRDFRWTDDELARPVAIISQTLAARFWPETIPIGEQVSTGEGRWEVIGVALETQQPWHDRRQYPQVYFSLLQQYEGAFTVMARAAATQTSSTVASMRQAVAELDPELPTLGPLSLSARISASVSELRLFNLLLATFGLLALTLTSVGLYGVLSHSVARRTREIAIRLAMGARRDQTIWLILKRALVLISIGLSIGVGVSFAGIRIIRGFVADLEPADPVIFLIPALVIMVASLLACWVPAYRITRLEPVEALRHE